MIRNLTYHILHKEQNGTATLELNPNQIEPNDAHQNFLDTLTKAYKGRASKGFGVFDEEKNATFIMPKFLQNYLSDNNFENLTKNMMEKLKNEIESQTLATGGKVFIAHYQEQNKNYLLVAILSDSVGFSAKDWEILENEILDIEHLKYAGRIDLTAWQTKEGRYISFLKGQREVSAYFKRFLSCNDAIIEKEATKQLVGLVKEFSREQNHNLEQQTDFLNKAKSLLTDISNKGEVLVIAEFANYLFPSNPQLLIDKLSDTDTGVPDGFTPNKTALKPLTIFVGKRKHWQLSFDLDAINDGDISILKREDDTYQIIINDPPKELLEANNL